MNHRKKLIHSTCDRCSITFEYEGYTYKKRKYCDKCLPLRKLEVVSENARNPARLERVKQMGLANRGHSRNQSEKHGLWKGDRVGKDALHRWVERRAGKPQVCAECGTTSSKKYDWANISQTYKRELSDFVRLCRSCHLKFDYRIGARHGR